MIQNIKNTADQIKLFLVERTKLLEEKSIRLESKDY